MVALVAGFRASCLHLSRRAEIEPAVLRRQLRPSVVIGGISFFAPFLGPRWHTRTRDALERRRLEDRGIAMSTTSVAVVYR